MYYSFTDLGSHYLLASESNMEQIYIMFLHAAWKLNGNWAMAA